MAADHEGIPNLLPEIVEKIALLLPLSHVCKCMQVCKLWKELLSSEQFCKRYVISHYSLDVEEEPSGLLKMWSTPDYWFCYWSSREDDNQTWVFSDLPKRWKCGIVHLADYGLKAHNDLKYKDFFRAVNILTRIQRMAEELNLECEAWCNEGAGPIEVCLFPWSKEALPTPDDILSKFKFHPEMHKGLMVDNKIETLEVNTQQEESDGRLRVRATWNTLGTSCDIDIIKACDFFAWLEKIFTPMTRICIGHEKMNPTPCFILAHLAPGWVGGILSSLTLT
ncbi:uncharacterized protein LOC144632585 [Oculina patagonica]